MKSTEMDLKKEEDIREGIEEFESMQHLSKTMNSYTTIATLHCDEKENETMEDGNILK